MFQRSKESPIYSRSVLVIRKRNMRKSKNVFKKDGGSWGSLSRKPIRAGDVANTNINRKKRDKPEYGKGSQIKQGGKDVADTSKRRYESSEKKIFSRGDSIVDRSWWAIESPVGRVAYGTPNRVERLKLLGNGQVVQVVQWIGKRIMDVDNLSQQGRRWKA